MSSAIRLLLCSLAHTSKKVLIPLFSILTLLLSFNSLAANGPDNAGRADYDLDDNGLIEINDLADLDEIRNNLDGKTLYGSNVGCPDAEDGTVNGGCIGFELKADLDFDTNKNGEIDAGDKYRNIYTDGIAEGWEPIGSYGQRIKFSSVFNGNGYLIENLTINRPASNSVGLFGYIGDALIENVVIAGPNSSIVGAGGVAGLVGHAGYNSIIRNVAVIANVKGSTFVGGLVGRIVGSTQIENSFSTGSVSGNTWVGGLVGASSNHSDLAYASFVDSTFSTAIVAGDVSVGGLVGLLGNVDVISSSYWAKDVSTQIYSDGRSEASSYIGLNLSTLQCAMVENTDSSTGCVSVDGSDEDLNAAVILYKGWNSDVWDFGVVPNENQQLPGLKFGNRIVRDGDGDGSLDGDDKWPLNHAASKDLDADGYPDAWSPGCDDACILASGLILDQFPHHAWAALDADFDGLPDGAENCVSDCQLDGLTKDGALGDHDNDGILDVVDADEDNDGINDVDADHDGLIDIDSLDKLNAMRFQLQGAGLQLTDISDVEVSGCPRILFQGSYQQRCSGYELSQDLDFDTNADGIIDENDDYWNENPEGIGEGWLPVGSIEEEDDFFNAHFNGNGHVIKNLTINRLEAEGVGLFGAVSNSYIENVVIAGSLTQVVGRDYVAALVGLAMINNTIINSSVTLSVQGKTGVGGLVGVAYLPIHVENILISGAVSGDIYVGGLAGGMFYIDGDAIPRSINKIISSAVVSGEAGVGGLVGILDGAQIYNSYWATDTSTQLESAESSAANSYVGLTLAKLQCAIAENTDFTSGCVSEDGSDEGLNAGVILYKDWDPAIWDFGTAPNANEQLPALKINGRVFRDRDADEVFDTEDDFPLNLAAAIDDDNDGLPDFWNPRCDIQCQADSGLVLDPFLNDTDNDGVENDFVPEEEPVVEVPPVVEPPITEPPVTGPVIDPSSPAEVSSGGSSGGGAIAWILLLLMTLAVLGQYRRYAKTEESLF